MSSSPAAGAPGADAPLHCSQRGKAHHVISPRIDRLLENVDSNYASVLVAAKRARQINSYYHNLGEGTFDEFPPPMIETASKNYLTIALEEVAAGKLNYHYR
jgi:DNA-directed RNA polymerase subunit omega